MEFRYQGEAFEQKFFARLTSKEIAELPKQNALIILPIGAVEQHGPHLPVFTDSLIAEGILHSACKHLKEEDNIWILPPIAYSKSIEHLGYAGTISLSGSTLEAMIKDIAASLKKADLENSSYLIHMEETMIYSIPLPAISALKQV